MDSHGVSYAALTVFSDELLQILPRNGTYKKIYLTVNDGIVG